MKVEIKNLKYSYPKSSFELNIDSMNIESNAVTALIGPNGAGKTTLLYLIAGLYKPDAGSINIDGMNYTENRNEIYSQAFFSVGESGFYNHLSAYENLKIHCIYRQIELSKIDEALSLVGLENNKKKYSKFSSGMKQRLNIGSALLFDPRLIVLDEPFNALDPGVIIELKDLFLDLNKSKDISFLISTHQLKEAESLSSHFAIMKEGTVVDFGKIGDEADFLEQKYRTTFINK